MTSWKTPRPGRPVRGSTTGRPVMVLLDLLGRRLTLRVIWELRGGGLTFRELQDRCGGASSSTLNRRLAELTDVRIVDHADGYRLTPAGEELLALLMPLRDWAEAWASDLTS